MLIKLFTSPCCPKCVAAENMMKTEGVEFTKLSAVTDCELLKQDLAERELDMPREGPVLIVDECAVVWAGSDCLIAIKDREWCD